MTRPQAYVTNLELRESNPDGSEGAGLSHRSEGLFLLHVLELASYGEPRGCVTVLHDAGDHGGRYEELAHVLARDGWAVALPDLRGHGRSEGERGHSFGFREVVRDVGAVLDHLAYRLPDVPQVLIGSGLGATQGLAFATLHPDRVAALVLLGPLLEPCFRLPGKKRGLAGLFKKVGPKTAGSLGWTPEERTGDAAEQRALASDELVHDAITVRAAEGFGEALEVLRGGASGLSVPTLVLHGARDPIASPERALALARTGVDVRVVEGAKHDLCHESGAEAVMRDVRDWLDRTLPRAAG